MVTSQARVAASSNLHAGVSSDSVDSGRTAHDSKTSLLNSPSPRSLVGPRFQDYNPFNYSDGSPHEDMELPRDGESLLPTTFIIRSTL